MSLEKDLGNSFEDFNNDITFFANILEGHINLEMLDFKRLYLLELSEKYSTNLMSIDPLRIEAFYYARFKQ